MRCRPRSLAVLVTVCCSAAGNARAQAPEPAPAPAPPAPPPAAAPVGGLRIDEAVQLALARNERARIAELQRTVADAAVERARSGFLPVISVNANDRQSIEAAAPNQPTNVGTAGISVTQPLLNPSAWPLYRQAERLQDAQEASSAEAKRLLSFDAANAFLAALTQEQVLEAAKRRLATAQDNLRDMQQRVEAQLVSSNDMTRSQVDLATAQQQVALAEGNVRRAYLSLSYLLNHPVNGPLTPPASTMQAATAPIANPLPLVAVAEDRRLDLVASRHQVRAAQLSADEPRLRWVPSVGLNGSATTTTNGGPTNHWHDETVTATLTWTIYDAGVRQADARSRDATLGIADLQRQTLERSIANDVLTAASTLAAAQGAMRAAAQAVQAAQRNVEETNILYGQGLAKAIEVTDANDSRFSSEVAYAQAQFTVAQAYMALREAMGLEPIGTELR